LTYIIFHNALAPQEATIHISMVSRILGPGADCEHLLLPILTR